jgi:hypothetical protein
MSLALYLDHNVQLAVADGLLTRGLDVLTARSDGFDRRSDRAMLERAAELDRVLFTQDMDFLVIAGEWQKSGRNFCGIVFAQHQVVTVGRAITDLELIAKLMTAEEIRNQLLYLPL